MAAYEIQSDGLVTAMLRYEVLIRVFDGDVDAWLEFLRGHAGKSWADSDREFLLWLKTHLRDEPGVIHRIREAVDTIEDALQAIPYPAVS